MQTKIQSSSIVAKLSTFLILLAHIKFYDMKNIFYGVSGVYSGAGFFV